MSLEHIGVDNAVHSGGRESCAACIAMVDDGFYPPGKDDYEPQPGWISLMGGHRQWVDDLNKIVFSRAENPRQPITLTNLETAEKVETEVDWVNPEHYRRGPKINAGKGIVRVLECIEVVRWIPDFRLANAIRYVWRVAFGGKWNDREDIEKAVWYLTDFLENPVKRDS